MKQITKNIFAGLENVKTKVLLSLTMLLASLTVMAQDGELDIDISVNEPEWYENIWIWIGLAVFIIIIVAIVSAGKKR